MEKHKLFSKDKKYFILNHSKIYILFKHIATLNAYNIMHISKSVIITIY